MKTAAVIDPSTRYPLAKVMTKITKFLTWNFFNDHQICSNRSCTSSTVCSHCAVTVQSLNKTVAGTDYTN